MLFLFFLFISHFSNFTKKYRWRRADTSNWHRHMSLPVHGRMRKFIWIGMYNSDSFYRLLVHHSTNRLATSNIRSVRRMEKVKRMHLEE